ncbi:DUF3995 domain-containing protein [Streptomyces anulatus]|uniref:DUF3995 domain-containing protein n=1 Tax=Streptomyces anulatus TaxID=1892 RepID=UPI0033D81D04
MTYANSAPADESVNSGDRETEIELPSRPLWVHSAFVFTLLYTAFHVYWAVGGTWGLPLWGQHNQSEVQAVNWVVSAIMLCGAFWVLALLHPAARRVPSWIVLLPLWGAAVVCISHAFFGWVTKGLYLAGMKSAVDFPVVPGVSAATADKENHLSAVIDILVFEPCFLIQGLVLAMAAWQFIRTAANRRRWVWSLVVGVVLVDLFGVTLSLAGLKFAIG